MGASDQIDREIALQSVFRIPKGNEARLFKKRWGSS